MSHSNASWQGMLGFGTQSSLWSVLAFSVPPSETANPLTKHCCVSTRPQRKNKTRATPCTAACVCFFFRLQGVWRQGTSTSNDHFHGHSRGHANSRHRHHHSQLRAPTNICQGSSCTVAYSVTYFFRQFFFGSAHHPLRFILIVTPHLSQVIFSSLSLTSAVHLQFTSHERPTRHHICLHGGTQLLQSICPESDN